MTSPREQAEALARALDGDDFRTVRALLAADCTYTVGGERLVGPDAIAASYEAASARARSLFDEVTYEHELEAVDARSFRVRYLDRLRTGDETHDHWSEQLVTVDPAAGVVAIEHRELPGERAGLREFADRADVDLG